MQRLDTKIQKCLSWKGPQIVVINSMPSEARQVSDMSNGSAVRAEADWEIHVRSKGVTRIKLHLTVVTGVQLLSCQIL